MINKVILIGHVGKDPEVRAVGTENVANFSLACAEKWKDKQGNQKERTEWFNLECWKGLANISQQYVKKGAKLYIEGSFRTESWDDSTTGEKKYRTKVTVNVLKMLGGQQQQQSSGQQPPPPEDDLPF